ncbi:class I SAM-dependent methyltransferase [Streptomyces qinzhouensis]|uniref:Class I SAM-dependent methyltransferase n=1 Tax=Streptomyces qinzhouensis TaxID=2599401 RepID=A0A5B8JD21_9ACTN|nr:class I SAM-dependent methyltransferase [Streptomyces qinzhouensis]QDY79665.1 class I SAM-dependent methyltransferase [Streptomyces qinzhouensis]
MFTSSGPTLRELAVQALSSVERGYDLLAPKFDETPFRTPGRFLDPFVAAVLPLGPFRTGLDVCTGTGAGVGVLRRLCEERVVGVDFSAGMLDRARAARPPGSGETSGPDPAAHPGAGPAVDWVRADARALPFAAGFDLAVSFGAFGHFLPGERPALFAGVCRALRPGGVFAFPLPAPPPVGSLPYWTLWGFDAAMRVRNRVWRPPFVMYYRTFPLGPVRADLERAGFAVELRAMEELGRRPDGSPNCRLVVARRRS